MLRSESAQPRRLPAWPWLVTVCAGLLMAVGLVLAAWWGISREERVATYAVRGSLDEIRFDLGDADLEVVGVGGGAPVVVRRTDVYAFGRPAVAERGVREGVLVLRSRCPSAVVATCRAGYRVRVPENVPLVVRTANGDVHLEGYRGSARIDTAEGNVDVVGWCGFSLRVRAGEGDVRAASTCAPERLDLRSRTGDVRARVPAGRYRVDADSDAGGRSVRGLTVAEDAPFQIQALSGEGDVTVEGGL